MKLFHFTPCQHYQVRIEQVKTRFREPSQEVTAFVQEMTGEGLNQSLQTEMK